MNTVDIIDGNPLVYKRQVVDLFLVVVHCQWVTRRENLLVAKVIRIPKTKPLVFESGPDPLLLLAPADIQDYRVTKLRRTGSQVLGDGTVWVVEADMVAVLV
jgi:hypothetical protein